jgi:hypothetical protein
MLLKQLLNHVLLMSCGLFHAKSSNFAKVCGSYISYLNETWYNHSVT